MAGWSLPTSHVTVSSAAEVQSLFAPASPSVQLAQRYKAAGQPQHDSPPTPSQDAASQDAAAEAVTQPPDTAIVSYDDAPLSLPLGKSRILLTQTVHSRAAGSSKTIPGNIDCLMYTGGPVWSAAFCPVGDAVSAPATAPDLEQPPSTVGKDHGSQQAPAAKRARGPSGAAKQAATVQEVEPAQGNGTASNMWPRGARAWSCGGDLGRRTELLAVAVHPAGHTRTQLGTRHTGPGAVQLWAVPNSTESEVCPDGLPACMGALTHQGKLVWDMQWCQEPWLVLDPSNAEETASPSHVSVMGVLAMAVGDGTVQVLLVPDPTQPPLVEQLNAAREAGKGKEGDAEAAAAVGVMPGIAVQPTVVIEPHQLGGASASTVAWRPNKPGLLIGCWDGSTSLWQLPGTSSQPLARLTPLCLIRVDGSPVRRVMWHPTTSSPGAAATAGRGGLGRSPLQSLDEGHNHQFLVCSQSGHMRIWDDRDLFCPIIDKLLSRTAVYDAVWVSSPSRLCVVAVLDDGSTRQLELHAGHHAASQEKSNWITVMTGLDPACLWTIGYSPALGLAAMAGEDGVVVLASCESEADTRARKPHVPVGGIVSDRGVLRVVGPRELGGLPCVFRGALGQPVGKGAVSVSELRDSAQTIYKVTWSPNTASTSCTDGPKSTGTAAWLAFGGLLGFVRCMRVGVNV